MRWKPLTVLVLVLSLSLAAAACGDDDGDAVATEGTAAAEAPTEESAGGAEEATGTVTIEHYSGTDEVPVDPETVVVMDAGVLLSMDALGIEADGFGSLGAVPEEFAGVLEDPDLEPVGTSFEPDYEAINAMEPDLIIVATRSSATYPEMSKIAPTVDLTMAEDLDPVDAFRQRHEDLGRIFGVEDEVASHLDALEADMEELAGRTADAGDALILMTNGAEVSAYGPGSRFGLVHDVLGYAPADDALSEEATHGEAVSFEFILEARPDVLFVIDRSAATGQEGDAAEQVLDNELVRQTAAWTDERVVYVDSFAWYIASHSLPGMQQILADVESSLP